MPIEKIKDKRSLFIEQSNKIHNYFYDYSFVEPFTNKEQKVIIKCPIHGLFEQRIVHHERGYGCKKCSLIRVSNFHVSNLEKFIEKALKLHNNKYDYSKFIYSKSWDKSIIVCPVHGEFLCSPNKHLIGRGCPSCGRISTSQKRKTCPNKILSKFYEIHKNKYTYPDFNYLGDEIKITVCCSLHGNFLCSPNNHLKGKGCPKCRGYYKSTQEAISEIELKYPGEFIFDKFSYKLADDIVEIGCNKNKQHGYFKVMFSKLRMGQGCPTCHASLGERTILSFLKRNNIKHIYHFRTEECKSIVNGRPLEFDFFLPEHNLIIEYDGEQHYEPVPFNGASYESMMKAYNRTQTNDLIKTNYCRDNNIDLLRIPYTEFKSIEEILTKKLGIIKN